MPIFNQIELFLDDSYSKEEQKAFIFKSRSMCNYLERSLVEKKFDTSFSRVNIHCTKDENKVRIVPLEEAPILEVFIKYDLSPSLMLNKEGLSQEYMKIISIGLIAANEFMSIPYEYCMCVLNEFSDGGYINEWVQAQKFWNKQSLRCDVIAKLSMEKFSLIENIYFNDDLFLSKEVVETKPREMLFYDYLGTLSLDQSGRVIYKKKHKLLTMFDLETNIFNISDDVKNRM